MPHPEAHPVQADAGGEEYQGRARANPVRLLRLPRRHPLLAGLSEHVRTRMLARANGRGRPASAVAITLGLLAAYWFAVMRFGVYRFFVFPADFFAWTFAAWILLVLVIPYAVTVTVCRIPANRRVNAWAGKRICSACGYEVGEREDGRAVSVRCPECASPEIIRFPELPQKSR